MAQRTFVRHLTNVFGTAKHEIIQLNGSQSGSNTPSLDSLFDTFITGSAHYFGYRINGYISDVDGINIWVGFGFLNSDGNYAWLVAFTFAGIYLFTRRGSTTFASYKINMTAV